MGKKKNKNTQNTQAPQSDSQSKPASQQTAKTVLGKPPSTASTPTDPLAKVNSEKAWVWQDEETHYSNEMVRKYFTQYLSRHPEINELLGGDGLIEILRCLENQRGLCRFSELPFDYNETSLYSPDVIIKQNTPRLVCKFVPILLRPWNSPVEWKKFARLIIDSIDDRGDQHDDGEEDDESDYSSDD